MLARVVGPGIGLVRHLVVKFASSFEAGQPVLGRLQVGHLSRAASALRSVSAKSAFDPPGPKARSPGATEIGTHVRFASDAEPAAHRSIGELAEVRIHGCRRDWDPVHPADDSLVGHGWTCHADDATPEIEAWSDAGGSAPRRSATVGEYQIRPK